MQVRIDRHDTIKKAEKTPNMQHAGRYEKSVKKKRNKGANQRPTRWDETREDVLAGRWPLCMRR